MHNRLNYFIFMNSIMEKKRFSIGWVLLPHEWNMYISNQSTCSIGPYFGPCVVLELLPLVCPFYDLVSWRLKCHGFHIKRSRNQTRFSSKKNEYTKYYSFEYFYNLIFLHYIQYIMFFLKNVLKFIHYIFFWGGVNFTVQNLHYVLFIIFSIKM